MDGQIGSMAAMTLDLHLFESYVACIFYLVVLLAFYLYGSHQWIN